MGEETLPEVAGADTGGIKRHQQRVRRHDGFVRLAGAQSHGGKVFLNEAAFVERGDEELECLLHGRIFGGRPSLIGKVFGKRSFARRGLHHVPAAFLVLLRVALGTDFLVIALVPIFLHALQRIKVVVTKGKFARAFLFR